MIPKCSNLVHGMTLGYPRSDMVWGLKGQKSRLVLGLWLGYSKGRGFELSECLLRRYTDVKEHDEDNGGL